MATSAHETMLELGENGFTSPWKGKLIIQGCVLCDMSLWSTYDTVIPVQLPQELDFKYVMKVSSLKERLPEVAFRRQNYLKQKVCCQDLCFDLYEVELSNKQGKSIDKLTKYIKNKQLAIIKCLEDRGVFILLTSSALIPEPDTGDEHMGLHGLHLFHLPLPTGVKDLNIEDDISLKVMPVLPALNYALVEAKKFLPEKGIPPNVLVKHNFQELCKVDGSLSLVTAPQNGVKETALGGKLSSSFDLVPSPEKCALESLTQLKSYFSDPSGYALEVSFALDSLAEHPQSPCISDGICDAGFSLAMTPDPEFLDSEVEVQKETETKKNSKKLLRGKKKAMAVLTSPSNLRVQPKRKASMPTTVPSKRVNLRQPLAKRTAPRTDSGSHTTTTLKLVKGQFPQKRKRGAEVLTAQFIQKPKPGRKSQEASFSKDVPEAANVKRSRKQEKSPVKIPWEKPPLKKSPQKRRVNMVRGCQNPKVRKQPQSVYSEARKETTLNLQSEISSDGQKDGINQSTTQPESIVVAPADLPVNSIINYDSQALNMLADLALSSAASSTPSCELINLPCSSELTQNSVLLSKESSLHAASDHEYHRGVKSQKGGLLPKPSSDGKNNSESDLTVNQEEENLIPCNEPAKTQSGLPEVAQESSGANQNSVAVEHSYALLFAEHSKKQLHQRRLPSPVFAKNGIKGPEAGTPIGMVMPFRHLQNTSPLQKVSEDSLTKRKSRNASSILKDFFYSHTVLNCDGSFRITFRCEAEYAFSLDSKYTNNPLEKTVVRALHGPWDTSLPEDMEEVKLLLHTWVALFYSKKNKLMTSLRKVVEHKNPAKYVCINKALESVDHNEIEESSSVEKCSADPLLETNEASKSHAINVSFPGPNCVLPLIKPPPPRDLELCVQNEQKEVFTGECHLDTSESQNFIFSCNEVTQGKAKQLSDKLESSTVVLSHIASAQTIGSCISGEDKTFQSLHSTFNDSVVQATLTTPYDRASSESLMCQKSSFSTLDNKVDICHPVQMQTSSLQDLVQRSTECQSALERTDGNTEYVMINLEPVTFAFGKNAYVPVYTQDTTGKSIGFNTEVVKQASPTMTLQCPASSLEKVQTQRLGDIPSLEISRQNNTKYISASVEKVTLSKNLYPLQKELPLRISSPPADKASVMEALSLVKSSSYSLANETKYPQHAFLQTQNLLSSSEEIMEPLQVKVVSSPTTAALEKKYSLNCTSRSPASDGSLELRDGDRNSLNHEKILESLNSVLSKQTSLSVNGEQDSMELSGGDPDIGLTLTISPPLSPKEDKTADEMEQLQKSPVPSLGLQNRAEEVVDPEEEATLIKDREVNSAGYMPACPVASEEPLKGERKGDALKPPTLILPEESCTLESSKEVNISNFLFNPLIEEVSPAASPDTLLRTEETEPSEAASQYCLKHNSARYEKSKSSKIESGDLVIPEKENSFVGPTHPVGLEMLTQVQERQLSAEIPQILANHPERKEKLTLPDKVTEKIAPSKHDKCFSHSEKVPSHDTELLKPTSSAKYEGNLKSLEKPIKSGNPLQPICIENRKHLVLESNDLPSSPRKITENNSSTDMFVSTTTVSGIVNKSMQQKTNPKLRNVCDCDLKTGTGSSVHVESLHSDSIDRTNVTQMHLHPEIPKLGSSDSATYTHDTRPVTVDPGFQTQEIPVVRMASLLRDIETELHEKITDLNTVGLQSNSTSTKSELIHVLQGTSACEIKTLLNTGIFPMYGLPYQRTVDTSESFIQEPLVSSVPESFDSVAYGVSREHVTSESTSEGITATADSETLGRDGEMNVASDMHYEPLSGDSDQDSPEDCRNPSLNTDNSCSLRGNKEDASKEDAIKDHYDSSISLNCSGEDTWGYSNEVSKLEVHISPKDWPPGPCHTLIKDECMPCYVQIPDFHGIPRTYANFTITKEFKDTTRTLHGIKRQRNFTANHGLLSSWTDTWHVADDPTQNTLDLEHLRFEHKLKQILKKGCSQQYASSTTIFSKESPTEVAVGAFPLTETSKTSVVHPLSKSSSPLLVTIVPSHTKLQSLHRRDSSLSRLHSSSSICKESRNPMNSERNQTAPFHLNKLKYNSTLKESRNDISQILNEYAEFDKVMMNSNQNALQDKQMSEVSEDTTFQETCSPVPRRSPSYKDMITDLCATLHIKLKGVVREACRNPFQFYLIETEDKSFFLRTKSILRKGGHTEIEPLHFSQDVHRENTTLVVIIRNEDISSHLHQVPSLLKLKHSPSVIFAGVDSPEDVLNDTYQDLFHSGGFVISDNKMIGNLTLAQLKEIVKILEKLNENGRWKWLLHYKENKKLKEGMRVDPIARKKNLILRSYQGVNIIELLPYHDCDSISPTRTEILKCLINLQIQHVSSRFAVFLTSDMPTGSTEVFENSGILVTDVNYFIENMQKIAAPFKSSCW